MLQILNVLFFIGMSSDVLALKVLVFANDFEILIGVNEY